MCAAVVLLLALCVLLCRLRGFELCVVCIIKKKYILVSIAQRAGGNKKKRFISYFKLQPTDSNDTDN